MTLAERYAAILARFRQLMPAPKTELNYGSPFQLLCAVILSAQCTDKRVNLITPALFDAFPTPHALAVATEERVFSLIRSCSYPNNKTKSLIGMARKLVADHGGEVPSDMDALLELPGVGRKTANVILAVIWGRAAMPVDTHVFRVSERLGLTCGSKSPLQTEKILTDNIPAADIADAHHWLILHGRYVCKARRPDCQNCILTDLCRFYEKT
ncbi:MAG: endonuclease III [Bacteroidales bacterium]|nr:endonuclease III [Bacteroidales bacterium]